MRGIAVRLLATMMLLFPMAGSAQAPEDETLRLVEGDVTCPRIALIFTIGVSGQPSEAVLQTLVEHDTPATMFPTGSFARAHPEYLRRIDAAGFEIGTYGDTDLQLTNAPDEVIRADIRASVDAVEEGIGRQIDPYHAPYAGNTDDRVRSVVASEGLLPVGWRVSSAGASVDATEDRVYNAVAHNVYPGAIVETQLDGPTTNRSTALALPRLIHDLRERGYEFVTIGGMRGPCATVATTPVEPMTMSGLDVHGLHCKSAPTPGATTLRILFNGDVVMPRGPAFDGWLPVECAGYDGWVKASALP